MRDHLEIGCTPTEENCFPVNHPLCRKECHIYKRQLERTFPGVEFTVRSNPHDFGTYYEVAAMFDTDNEASCDAAFTAECGCDHWDAIAKQEIEALQAQVAQVAQVVQGSAPHQVAQVVQGSAPHQALSS